MTTLKEKEAYTQVLNILYNLGKDYYSNIPQQIIEKMINNKIKYYQYYDENGKLKISTLAEQILCYINLEYWCNDEEKQYLINKYKENDIILNEKYDVNKIFEKRKTKKEEKALTEFKQSWIEKVIKKIKELFSKKSKL